MPLGVLVTLSLPGAHVVAGDAADPGAFGSEYTRAQSRSPIRVMFVNIVGGYVGAALAYVLRNIVHARDRLMVEEAMAGRRPFRP